MHHPMRVLFLCDENAGLSQMAEGFLKTLGGDGFEVHSGGLMPTALDPLAVTAMHEVGIDISKQDSKHLNDYMDTQFDYIVTLCAQVKNSCLAYPRDGHAVHWQIPDPTETKGDHEEKLAAFRMARDAIAEKIRSWIIDLKG